MGTLRLGSFEVEKADLVPKEGADVALERREAVRRAVTETMNTDALS